MRSRQPSVFSGQPAHGSYDFNGHQGGAVQAYGTGQAAVDYILSARYGAMPSAGPSAGPEGFGMVAFGGHPPSCGCGCPEGSSFPSAYDLRYRGF